MIDDFEPLNTNRSTRQREIGKIDLGDTAQEFNVKKLAEFFSDNSHLPIPGGNEYILDENERTILLFGDRTENGFGSIYSPLSSSELRAKLSHLPQEEQNRLFSLLGMSQEEVVEERAQQSSPYISLKPIYKHSLDVRESTVRITEEHATHRDSRLLTDLPEDHFVELSLEEYERKKAEHWEKVKDLYDNDPRKIMYFRRFTSEFSSPAAFNPSLIRQTVEGKFRFYEIDTSKLEELPKVDPYTAEVDIPKDVKVGFVVGYHHLEKPWGHIFMEMFKEQITYDSSQIEFIIIENQDIPTGEQSTSSRREILDAVNERGITHVIDLHEQLSSLNHYSVSHFEPKFAEGGSKNPGGHEVTFDPFIPTWMIEQYYEGNVYPQLQYAVNDQFKRAVSLLSKIGETQD